MAEGRNKVLWDHSSVVAAFAGSFMRTIDPAKINPYTRKQATRVYKVPAGEFVRMFAMALGAKQV